ncbi:MAG: Ubiquitin-like protein [Chaenotheca gracillima]|nr:MAG: Ubiquitin-like protein [Chaenotheca gracillima]
MWSLGGLLLFTLCAIPLYTIGRYLSDKKKLRRFPAPSIAAFTPLWIMYYSWKKQRRVAVDAAHQKYGEVVRIAPNHISFTNPDAYKDIYGFGSTALKDEFYAHQASGNPSMAETTSKADHSRKRRSMANVFSAKEIGAMEPRIAQLTQTLLRDLKLKSEGKSIGSGDVYKVVDGTFDLRPWLNMFSYDAITAMLFSNSYGFLDKGNDLCSARTPEGTIKHVHAMDTFQTGAGFSVLFAHLPLFFYNLGRQIFKHSYAQQCGPNFASMARYMVNERVTNPPNEPDLSTSVLEPPASRGAPMPLTEYTAECATMMNAGNDTTQISLTNCLYQLASHPMIQEKLYTALVEGLPSRKSDPVASYAELQQIPYLRAVLDESFRCRTPVAFGLPRRTVGDGATIAGYYIPPDVTVSSPISAIHENATLFTDPKSFVPERWLTDDSTYSSTPNFKQYEAEKLNLKNYCIPFSVGGRACIGRNLAYMDLSIVVAALVLGFKWDLVKERHPNGLEIVEKFNSYNKELIVRANAREGVKF